MHLCSSLSFIFLVFLINFHSIDNTTILCTNDKECPVSHRICAECVSIKKNVTLYPSCTTGICIDGKCGTLNVCSLQLTGTCKVDGDCIRNFLCLGCMVNKAPSCVKARCINRKCALIKPCTITLDN